jgi:hypothetical protein
MGLGPHAVTIRHIDQVKTILGHKNANLASKSLARIIPEAHLVNNPS